MPAPAIRAGGTAILRIESRRRLRGSLILLGVLAVLSAMYISMFPDIEEDMDELVEIFPPWMFDMFGLEALHTIEGFLAAEIYSFFWPLLVGIYFAHLGAGMIAGDVQDRRMDLTLSNPVSRESVVFQKVVSLWVPVLVINVGVIVTLLLGTSLIDRPLDPVALTMLHVLTTPYLLVCAGIGLVLSVVLAHPRSAKAMAIGLVFILWLIEGASNLDESYEWIGAFTPSRYFDEAAILVREEYAYSDAGVLLAAFIVLVAVAMFIFIRRDI